MKSIVYPGNGEAVEIKNLDPPIVDPDDVLVKIAFCGISDFDRVLVSGTPYDYPSGIICREFTGTVAKLGRNVLNFNIGDRVSIMPYVDCGHCDAYNHGNEVIFPRKTVFTFGMSEYCSVPTNVVFGTPE